ncbi:MAG: hypothetical protein UW69_C0022G0005 [Microgenomates group bacterium GW2011_GWA2_44_7]|nr:MAG: hypothetical protein UW69_C0022G0005 [Microgenomates group bacterium GW2011_GWA2_44_7]KKT78204.1 MAG: hypothetical protein UW73_C0005G0029 [Microgenomates group bacterium GW2011_GWB1_44_8]
MTEQNIIKTFGFLVLSIFAVGIFFLSARSNQVEAKNLVKGGQEMTAHMANSNMSYEGHDDLTPEQKKEMFALMKQHHGDNWQNHHQQMHGSQSGT